MAVFLGAFPPGLWSRRKNDAAPSPELFFSRTWLRALV